MAYKYQLGAATLSGSLTQEGSISIKDDSGTLKASVDNTGVISGSSHLESGGNLQIAGTVKLDGVADAAIAVSADSLYFKDADGSMKSDTVADLMTAAAGDGLVASSGVLAVNVADMASAMTGDVADTDEFAISDGGTMKKVDFSVVRDAVFADVSGDATIAAGGALTIAAASVENSMLADDAVGADELAANAVVEASIVDNAVTLAKMAGITRGSIILGDASGDPSYLAKGGAATFLQSDGTDPSYVSISGDATVAAGGALTIANDAVETAMLNDNVISGQTELAQGSLAAADEFLLSDGGALKRFGVDSFAKDALALTTEAAIADGDYITFLDGGATGETKKESLADLATLFAGDGLSAASSVLSLSTSGSALTIASDKLGISGSIAGDCLGSGPGDGVDSIRTLHVVADESTIESVGRTTLQVKAAGITATQLATSVAGAGLAGGGGTALSLDIDELNALGGTGVAQGDHFVFSDDGTEKKITFSNMEDAIFGNVSGDATVAAGGALTIANDAIETGMLNDNIISGQTELAHADIADADEFMISDGGTLKRVGVDSLRDHYFGVVSGDATVADGGALTIAANAVEDSMVNDNVATGLAGVGLSAASGVMALDLNELSAAAVDVANDSIALIDANDSNGSKKESIADLMTAAAGAGLTATSGVLSVTGNNVSLKADGNALVEGYNYFANASSNATVTMPASPSVGDVVTAKAGNLTSGATIIINKGSADHRIDGLEGIIIESPFGAVTMVYVVADNWKIV
jgi:hypothetical protein